MLPELVSDNYSVHGTGLAKDYDFPRDITPSVVNSTGSSTGTYWEAQELKALATFVLEDIVPGDETATPADVAELMAGSTGRGQAQVALGPHQRPVADIRWEGELDGTVFSRASELCGSERWAGIQLWAEHAREPARYGDPRPEVAAPDGHTLRIAAGGFAQPSDDGGVALARHVAQLIEPTDRVVERPTPSVPPRVCKPK